MDPVEFRIKNLPPEAPNAMWARVPRAKARRRSAGTSGIRPAIRRPGRSRPAWACAISTWGGGGRGPSQAHCEITSDGSVVMRVRHAGPRHRHAHARRDRRGRDARPASRAQVKPEIGDTSYRVSGGSGGSTTAARHQPGDSRRRGQGARRAEGESRAGARRRRRRRSSPPAAASTSRTTRRRACRGPTRAS